MDSIFLTEPIHEDGVKLLEMAANVVHGTSSDKDAIIRDAQGCTGILVRSAVITEEIMDAIPTLKVVAKHGIGVDNIDIKAASSRKILVLNAPESNINAVAEHTVGMMFALCKNYAFMDENTRKGGFLLRNKYKNFEIKGKTVGFIGLGKIGMLVAKKLGCVGVRMIGYDPYIKKEIAGQAGIELVEDINQIYAESDFVTIHVPLTNETRGMINSQTLNKMKSTAYLINVARGPIVNEGDLYQALKSGVIRGAAIDVFEQEPPSPDNPLFMLDNILLSPHNAALTEEALLAMAVQSAQGIVDFIQKRKPKYIVNKEVYDKIER